MVLISDRGGKAYNKMGKDIKRQITKEETHMVRKHLKNVPPTGVNGNANKSTNGAILSTPVSWQQIWWGRGIKGNSYLLLVGVKAADVH